MPLDRPLPFNHQAVVALEQAPDRYLLLRYDLSIAGATAAFLQATGTDRAALIGRPVEAALGPAFHAAMLRARDARFGGPQPLPVRGWSVQGSLLADPEGNPALVLCRLEVTAETESEALVSNRRLTLLTRVARELIGAEDLLQSLDDAFSAVAAEIGAELCFSYLVDDDDPGALVLRAARGSASEVSRRYARIRIGEHLSGRVALWRQPVVLADIDRQTDTASDAARTLAVRCYAGFPLVAHRHLFGAFSFASTRRSRFEPAEIEFFGTLADLFAAALDHNRLLRSLRESEQSYRAALTAGRMGSWETDYATGTRTWTPEGQALFGLDLPDGRGIVGGDDDEFRRALYPEDRHLVEHFRTIADSEDSFPAEYRVVRPDGATVWLSGRGRVTARGPDGKAQRLISIMADITERKAGEQHVRLLLRELSHRSKNLLAVIQAIAGQTARSAGTVQDFQQRFLPRLHGLAASQDLLVSVNWHGVSLVDLLRQQLAPFADLDGRRLAAAGPAVTLTAEAAQVLGLAFHELATNAIRHGALTAPGGRIGVAWSLDPAPEGGRALTLTWTEQGGPAVVPPASMGFGRAVIERLAAQSLGAEAALDFAATGLRWTIRIPAPQFSADPTVPAGRDRLR